MSWSSAQPKAEEAAELLADLHPLARQVGAPAAPTLHSLWLALQVEPVNSLPALRVFLEQIQAQHLFPVELPAVYRAYLHASRGEVKELIAFDRKLGSNHLPQDLSEASRFVGKRQLRKLRPLKDSRLVQRYLEAVDNGKAYGWHTVVYGVVLALYSIPLRQGLLHYACQTQLSFLAAAAHPLQLSAEDLRLLEEKTVQALPAGIESQVLDESSSRLQVL